MAIQKITSGIIADGAITAADIEANSITFDKIVSVSNTAIAGLIQSAQIGSANASVIDAGTLTAARLPAGSVLQVVQATFSNTQETTTSTSYANTSLTASITPASASNKVLVLITSQCQPDSGAYIALGIKRNSTDVANGINYTGTNTWAPISISFLDSPSSTSAVSYTLRFKSSNGSIVYHGWGSGLGGSTQSIVLMEIAA